MTTTRGVTWTCTRCQCTGRKGSLCETCGTSKNTGTWSNVPANPSHGPDKGRGKRGGGKQAKGSGKGKGPISAKYQGNNPWPGTCYAPLGNEGGAKPGGHSKAAPAKLNTNRFDPLADLEGFIPEEELEEVCRQKEEADRLSAEVKAKTALMAAARSQAKRESSDEFGWRRARGLESSLRKKEAVLNNLKTSQDWHNNKLKDIAAACARAEGDIRKIKEDLTSATQASEALDPEDPWKTLAWINQVTDPVEGQKLKDVANQIKKHGTSSRRARGPNQPNARRRRQAPRQPADRQSQAGK